MVSSSLVQSKGFDKGLNTTLVSGVVQSLINKVTVSCILFFNVSQICFSRSGFKDPEIVCVSALGLENGQIPNAAIVASSQYNAYYGPERARLRKVTAGSFIGGWSPKASNTGEWIQFDFGENTKVTRIAIQGRDNADWWTTSFTMSSKLNGGSFESYNNGQVLLQ